MKRDTCSECQAYNSLANECRRHAPVMVPIPQDGRVASMGLYPATPSSGWCLEFIRDPVKVQ